MIDALETALSWLDAGHEAMLATVVHTWGSAPRPAGSHMVVRDDGVFAGSVSGGCVEGHIIGLAPDVLSRRTPRLCEFGVSAEDAWSFGLACGGTITIHLLALTRAHREPLQAMTEARAQTRAAVLAIGLGDGALTALSGTGGDALDAHAAAAIASDRPSLVECGGKRWFLAVENVAPDLVIIGAVHIAQTLAALARLSDFDVRIIDPRAAFATGDRFPGVALSHEWPDQALARSPLGPRSALVALSHDPKLDDPALIAALSSEAFYIAALGSKTSHAQRLTRLAASGVSPEQLARIHGPAGLAIGARSPAEIAISILAEAVHTLRREKRPDGSLKGGTPSGSSP